MRTTALSEAARSACLLEHKTPDAEWEAVASASGAARAIAADATEGRALRVLLVEDNENDAALMLAELRRGGFEPISERVQTRVAMEAALNRQRWDLIIADHNLPRFSAPDALDVLQRSGHDVPFLIVSGNIDEHVAVAAMEAGARDCISKRHLGRLLPAVARELRDAEIRRERRRAEQALRASEERYRDLVENANDMVYTHDLAGKFTSINKAAECISGYTRDEALDLTITHIVAPEHLELAVRMTERQLAGEKPPAYQLDIITKDGRRLTVELNTRLMYRDGQPVGVQGIARDITARKRAEQRSAALLEVARDISGTLNLEALLDRVQRRTAEVLPCDRVATFYPDPQTDTVRMRSHYGIPPDLIAGAHALAFSPDDPSRALLETGQTVVLNDPSEQAWVAELFAHFRIATLAAVPLRVHGHYLGALTVTNDDPHRGFDADQVALLEGIARQLAVAIEATELYQIQREEAEAAAAQARVGRELITVLDAPALPHRLCQLTTEALHCDASHIFFWRPEEDAYVPLAGDGYAPEALEVLRLLKVPRSMVAIPLAVFDRDDVGQVITTESSDPVLAGVQRECGLAVALYSVLRRGPGIVGILVAGYRDAGRVFTPQQHRIARGIAQMASLAIEKAQLVERLERADRLKSEFVATMSHELRTPLNIIMGYNELLLEGVFGSLTHEQEDSLQRIHKSTLELLDLISATLDLSRLEAGQLPVDFHEVSASEVVRPLEAETLACCKTRDLEFTWDVAPELPRLHTDPMKLKVVLKNLIANAVKFTEHGGVTVSVYPADGGVQFRVSDTGVGIPPEVLPIIFEPFRQGDGSTTRRHGGIGLGLYVVRRLLEMLGGTITVDSTVGEGSTFSVWVPTSISPDHGVQRRAAGNGHATAEPYDLLAASPPAA